MCLSALTHAIETYPAPPEKLVVGLPLFFFDYTCDVGTAPDAQLCSIKDFYKTHNPDRATIAASDDRSSASPLPG